MNPKNIITTPTPNANNNSNDIHTKNESIEMFKNITQNPEDCIL